ncbi:MAG: TRAP transporter substrate-binding protein DctP [Planctomycetota bacterium]|jgi:TRAP-type C4-dicarboxylate transport system substrate-binding protein|nr:TRAP transporter substrate-binding protein DctP [Planctomycetota bacterium]
MSKSFAGYALAFILIFAAAGNVPAQETTLNLVFLANTSDEEYDSALVLKNYVESRSRNVTIEIFPGAQLCGGPRECFESIEAETVDIYVVTGGGVSVVYPPAAAMNLPYLFTSDEVVNELMTGPYVQVLRELVYRGTGGKLLVMTLSNTGGWRHYANTKRLVKSPGDIKGMKMRTVEDHVQMEQVKLHGGSPTPIPFMEVYTSLQTGVVDGTLNSISDLTNARLHERAKYMTLDGHNYMFCLWVMNTTRFRGLSEEDQDILAAGFDVMGRVQNGIQVRRELENWETFSKDGGKTYVPAPAEKEAFVKAVEPVRQWYLKEYGAEGKKFLEAMDSAIADAEKIIAARHQYLKSGK